MPPWGASQAAPVAIGRSSVFFRMPQFTTFVRRLIYRRTLSDAPPAEAGTPNQGLRAPGPPFGVPASAGGAWSQFRRRLWNRAGSVLKLSCSPVAIHGPIFKSPHHATHVKLRCMSGPSEKSRRPGKETSDHASRRHVHPPWSQPSFLQNAAAHHVCPAVDLPSHFVGRPTG